jgi:hypothetical protein
VVVEMLPQMGQLIQVEVLEVEIILLQDILEDLVLL